MAATARILLYSDTGDGDDLAARLHDRGFLTLATGDRNTIAEVAANERPEIAIVDANDAASGTEVAFALRQTSIGRTLPTIIISEDAPADGDGDNLEYLPRGYHDVELFSRLELLARLITMQEELRRRSETTQGYGIDGHADVSVPEKIDGARILLLAEDGDGAEDIKAALARHGEVVAVGAPHEGIDRLLREDFDAAVMLADSNPQAALDFCADARSNTRLYNVPVLLVAEPGQYDDPAAPYGAGASDVVRRDAGIERLLLRTLHLIRLQRFREAMKEVYRTTRHATTGDALTGLFNHGFLHGHLHRLIADAQGGGKPLSVGFFILQNLEAINRMHGYIAGDRALRQIGGMMNSLVRAEDLPARYGGNKFCIVLPDTAREAAEPVLHRIAGVINFTEFSIPDVGEAVSVKLATGCAGLQPGDTAQTLIRRARADIGE